MKVKKILLCLIIILLFIAFLPIAVIHSLEAQTNKVVQFGITKDFPPYSWEDKNGKPKGFYMDIYTYIKKELEDKGYEVKIVYDTWPNLYNMLEKDKIQAIIGMSITPERKKLFYFSTPLHILVYRMYTIKHKYINNIEDLQHPVAPLTVAVLKDSSAEAYLKANFPSLFLKEYPTVEEGIKALINGDVDLLMGYQYVVDFYLKNTFKKHASSVYMLPIDFPGGHKWHAIAINRSQLQLSYEIDDIIRKLSENGVLSKLNNKWFGDTSHNIAQRKLIYYILFALMGIILVAFGYHLQLASMSRKLKALNREKDDQKSQLEYQMNELMAAREELTAMSEQLMAQQEELTYLYENERTLKNQLEKLNDFLTTLLAFFRVPEEGSDFSSQLRSFLNKTRKAFNASGVYLYTYSPETEMLSLIAYSGTPVPDTYVSPGLVQSFLLGKTTYLPASADPFASTLKVDDGYIISIPLVALKENKGVMILYFTRELPDNEKNNVISILENLSPSLAIYMENMMVIDAHLKEMTKLRELLEFIEKVISLTSLEKLLEAYTTFAKSVSEMEYATLIDEEGNTVNINHSDKLPDIDFKHLTNKEGWVFPDTNKRLKSLIIPLKIVDRTYRLILTSESPELLPEFTKSISYILKLATRFVSIYATNITNTNKLRELLKLRAKESTLLRRIVDYLLSDLPSDTNLVITLADIMEKSGIPVKVILNDKVIFGKQDIEKVDTMMIQFNGETYTLILGDTLPEYLKTTIQMWISVKEENNKWSRKIEEARMEWIGIIDSFLYPLVAIGDDGTIKKVNKAFSELVNIPIESLIGENIETIIPNILEACKDSKHQDQVWHCYEWLVDDIPIGKILIKGES